MQAVQRNMRKGSLNCVTPGVSVDQRHSITKSYGIWAAGHLRQVLDPLGVGLGRRKGVSATPADNRRSG
jgi:hypothetical protein